MTEKHDLFSPGRRRLALGAAALMVTSFLTYQWVAEELKGERAVDSVAARDFGTVKVDPVPLPTDGGAWEGPEKGRWPAAGATDIVLAGSAGRAVEGTAGSIKVAVKAVPGKKAPDRVRVTTLPEQQSTKLGLSGPVIAVEGDKAGDVETTVDFDNFSGLYGGGWAGRLNLASLPACAASTPERPECQDATSLKVAKGATTLTASLSVSAAGPTMLALAADTESGEGDYKASDLQASGSWTAGDSSGGFTYTNAIKLPPAQGPTPEIALSYSSQMVDGRTAGANNQASWAGDGWDYSPGFVERSYVGCYDDLAKVDDKDPNNKDKKTAGDQCWKDKSPTITVSLGGTNATLIKDDESGKWRPAQDSNWKVEQLGAVADKDSATTERWTITTPDGTRHFFAGEVATSNSRWTLPVFGNHAGETCHVDAYKDSSCAQAWRWLLDKQIDVHGNVTRYFYKKEIGHYGAAGDKNNRVSFDRGGNLERIEYGMNTAYPDVPATARVVFSAADRCFSDECYSDDKPVKANWPDVPWDKECTAEPCTDKLAPVFFSIKRLTKITTEVRSGSSSFSPVESWTLDQEFKAPKAAASASLWLKSITHAGHVGGTETDPPVVFTGVELANQVNVIAGVGLFSRWRIQNVRTESGADIFVTYNDADCDAGDLPAVENNTRLCYPVYWTPDGYFDPTRDWFRKYVVREITTYERTADQPPVTTRYAYSTEGTNSNVLWGWDDGEFTKNKHRTYGQWRGYSQVVTRVGQSDTGKVLTTRKRFFRGLDDQPLPDDKTRSVQVTDAAGTSYTDHPALAGTPLEEAQLDGDAVVEAQSTAYLIKQTAVRARTGGSDKAYRVAPSVQKSRKLIAAGVWQQTEKRTEYDDEGNVEWTSELGDTGKDGDETCTRFTYVGNDDPWVRGLVSREEQVAKACSETVSRPADVISDTRNYYDKSETHGTAPTKGLITRVDTLNEWKNGAPVYTTTGRNSYDALGRSTSETDSLGKVTATHYTPAGPGPVTQTRTVNPLGHEVVTDQNPAWSEPTSILDSNKKRTDLAHDPMGRLAKVWLPGRAKASATPNMEFSYLIRHNGPLAVTTKRLGANGNYITEIGLFDSLYRSIQTQEDGQKTKDGGDARLVSTTGYNDRGQVDFESDENYATGKPSTNRLLITPGEDRNRTVSTYDRLGRVVEEALWSHNIRQWATTTAYGGSSAGWQTAETPPEGGTPTVTIENSDGDVIEKREFHGSKPEGTFDATKYTYTPRGDLATVTKGAFTWKYEYDLRGREVKTTDPDKGVTTVEYNNADDVVKSTDVKGDIVTTSYDDLGRQKERFFNGVKAAAWTYDSVAKGHATKSTSIVNGYSFSKEIYEYNDAYQVVDEESVIPAMPGLTALAGTYVSTHTYTVNGLLHRSSLPKVGPMEKEGITRTYDDLGNIVKLAGTSSPSGTVRTYVDRATYSPYGEVLNRWLGTPVGEKPQAYQNYVYDDVTRRLSEFYFDRDGTVPNVAALKYEYDDAGNVLSMANRPVGADNNPRAGEEDVQCFDYDHLRRLTQAWSQTSIECGTPAAGGKAPYWKSWTFDQHGSRTTATDHVTQKTSNYAYDAGTHMLSTVTTDDKVDQYDWDERGNLKARKIGDRTESFTWSPHGKLTTISGPEGDTSMVYDVDGNRIARIDPDGAASVFVYGNEYTTTPASGTSATRYYEHAGDTVASRTDTTSRKGDIIWLGSDAQQSALWAVNSVTRAATIKYNDPYGSPRDASAPAVQWPSGQRGFVGGVADPTGLTLLGARFYDPRTGAFISVDPEVDEYDPQRLHPYAYANNNPTTFSDPDGLFWGSIKNGMQKAASSVARGVTTAAKAVVNNAGTIASVAGTIAMVAAVLPPPAQVVAAAAGAVAAVAGAIDTVKGCMGGDKLGCATGVAGMIPGVRQAKTAIRGIGAAKNAVKKGGEGIDDALAAAKAKADEASKIRPDKARPGVAEAIKTGSGKTIAHTSKVGEPPVLHPKVRRILSLVPNRLRGKGHGKCGLPVCLTEALNEGHNPRRAAAGAVTIRNKVTHKRHGVSVPPCGSCKWLSFWFGLRWSGPWRWWNRGFFGR